MPGFWLDNDNDNDNNGDNDNDVDNYNDVDNDSDIFEFKFRIHFWTALLNCFNLDSKEFDDICNIISLAFLYSFFFQVSNILMIREGMMVLWYHSESKYGVVNCSNYTNFSKWFLQFNDLLIY